MKLTEIFGYFRIYTSLTQKQLKQLTGFSPSTISTSLQTLLHRGILTREFIPNSHTNLYSLSETSGAFTYTENVNYVNRLVKYDQFVQNLQEESQYLEKTYPRFLKIFHMRLNGIRNFIEAQRRANTGKKTHSFFDEDISKLISKNEYISYPSEICKFELDFVNHFVSTGMFVKDDPIINKLLSYLTTRVFINQENLLTLSGFSRSTISRTLSGYGERGYVSVSKKEYLKPRLYTVNIMSLYLLEVVIRNDTFAINWKQNFDEIILKLKSVPHHYDETEYNLLIKLAQSIIDDIQNLERRTKLLIAAQNDLKKFLE